MRKFEVSAASRIGLVRSRNEDMILVKDRYVRNDSYTTEIEIQPSSRFLFAIADGLGGYSAGEIASAETLENLHFFIGDLPCGLNSKGFEDLMKGWLESINQIILSKGYVNDRLANMGTTLVAFACYEGMIFKMSCGDSRMYRLRENLLTQQTIDHSLNTMMGQTKHSNIVTNCIGAGCGASYLDIKEITDDVQNGDVFILCSDGLNDMVDDDTIQESISNGCDAETLCRQACDAGGYDNVSVCIVKIV